MNKKTFVTYVLLSKNLIAQVFQRHLRAIVHICHKQKSMAENHAFCGLGYPDSNQNKQNQNLLCYHYTIAQA